jgi:hypothetical protein
MTKRNPSFTASALYASASFATGLLLHPYQTLQSIVQEKVFLWMSFLPAAILVFLVINWRVWMLPTLEFWFECQPNYPYICRVVKLVAAWITFFCLYWQVLVSYLTVRFLTAFKEKQ